MAVGERAKDSSSDENLVRRIRAGDRDAERELVDTYYRGILMILRQRTRDMARAEDLAQETIMTVLTRLRTEGIDHPQYLRRYIQQTAKFLFIGWTRKAANSLDHVEYADDLSTDMPGLDETIAISRTRTAVRRLIKELRTERDREILRVIVKSGV
ncbi:MAG: sigma-70 family RNA polymerase sigma factor [Proteobacteria bacterium]|nr:sigma-70 family RNA polymerase sigma factor [Pseudomonadota bacterium]